MSEDLFALQLQLKMAQRRFKNLKTTPESSEDELSEAEEEVERLSKEYTEMKRLAVH